MTRKKNPLLTGVLGALVTVVIVIAAFGRSFVRREAIATPAAPAPAMTMRARADEV